MPDQRYESRITEDYLVSQVNGFRESETYLQHKKRIDDFDALYKGRFADIFPEESALPDEPLIENKLKNATHDLARLASEAKGAHVFMKEGESQAAGKRAAVRAAVADTLWHMGRGERIERKLYMDLIAAGMAAVAVYYNDRSDYPQFMRLDPRFIYPEERNGVLQNLVYCEVMKERQAALLWPDLGLKKNAKDTSQVYVVQYFDDEEVVQCVGTMGSERRMEKAHIVDGWKHGLGCVPVAWVPLDSADGTWHGLFDQLGGPMMVRNKIMRLLTDYLESMTHAPFEAKGVRNATAEPGPLTVYEHDETAPESFIRRVAPAAPSGSVFGVLQQMQAEEASEAIQPPARVGVVRQSIASGSFVDSTQGTLSSAIFELQEVMADLRYQINYIALKIDEKYLNREKALWRAIGNKNTYTPKEDINGFYHHSIQYGASAGLNRAEAGVRVLQDMGAGLISKELARQQLDYVDDPTVEQNRIDREQASNAFFQRLVGDPNTPMSTLALLVTEMGKGKDMLKALEVVAPHMVRAEEQAREQAAPEVPGAETAGPEELVEEEAALAAGATPVEPEFAPPPLQQQIVRNIF